MPDIFRLEITVAKVSNLKINVQNIKIECSFVVNINTLECRYTVLSSD